MLGSILSISHAIIKTLNELGVVTHTFNPRTWEAQIQS